MLGSNSFPPELLTEVGRQLDYSDAQLLRLVCKRFDYAVQPIALSRLRLDWPQDPYYFDYVVEQLEAYSKPGVTAAFKRVKHLTIGHICTNFGDPASFDERIGVTPKTNYMVAMKMRVNFFFDLVKDLFRGDALRGLKSITYALSIFLIQTFDELKHFAAGRYVSELAQHLRPLQRLEILYLFKRPKEPYAEPLLAVFPPSRKLIVRGLDLGLLDEAAENWYTQHTRQDMDEIDVDMCFDEERIKKFFPPMDQHSSPPPHFSSLTLLYIGFQFQPHVFGYLRNLRSIHVIVSHPQMSPNDVPADRRRLIISNLWKQFSKERLYLEEITVAMPEAEDSLLDYLVEYPRPMLTYLDISRPTALGDHDELGNVLPSLPGRFYREVLPVIAPRLQHLRVSIGYGEANDWCLGRIPEAAENFKACTELTTLEMAVDPEITNIEQRNELVTGIFGTLPNLKSVVVRPNLYPAGWEDEFDTIRLE
ncbi:hypothetical protein CVT24_004641 [Panaeolus cyanescens]|uniref:F-box domain-containing protein n=1 Tax=Panaeolus cyanescens TaxID=181874 RepID=A0A409YSI6_9AGAR|nr:hypothetical protein CVT24_004641 [Panaeolus cyanescens]